MPDTDAWILVPPQLEWEQPTSAPACARQATLDFHKRYPPVTAEDWIAAGSGPEAGSEDAAANPRRSLLQSAVSLLASEPRSRIYRPQTPLVPPAFQTPQAPDRPRLDESWLSVDSRGAVYPPSAEPPTHLPSPNTLYQRPSTGPPPCVPSPNAYPPSLPDISPLLPIPSHWPRPPPETQSAIARRISFDDVEGGGRAEQAQGMYLSPPSTYPPQPPPPTIPPYQPFTHPYFAPTLPPPDDPYEGYAPLSDGEDDDEVVIRSLQLTPGTLGLALPPGAGPPAPPVPSLATTPASPPSPQRGQISRACQTSPTICDACGAPSPGGTQWACSVCTLDNSAAAARCVACSAPPPHAPAPDAQRHVQRAQAKELHHAQLHRRPSRGDHAVV